MGHGGSNVISLPEPRKPELVLTLSEVANHLQLSLSSVKRLVRSGELVSIKIGAARRVRAGDLDDYIASRPPAAANQSPAA